MILHNLNGDKEYIKKCLLRDNLYMFLYTTVDSIDTDNLLWYEAETEEGRIGICIVQPFTANCLNFSAGIYERFRHKHTKQILTDCIQLLKQMFNNMQLIATCDEQNIPVLKSFLNVGFVQKTILYNAGTNGKNLVLFAEK